MSDALEAFKDIGSLLTLACNIGPMQLSASHQLIETVKREMPPEPGMPGLIGNPILRMKPMPRGSAYGMDLVESNLFPYETICRECEGTGSGGEYSTYCPRCHGQGATKTIGMLSTAPSDPFSRRSLENPKLTQIIMAPLPKKFAVSFPADTAIPPRRGVVITSHRMEQ